MKELPHVVAVLPYGDTSKVRILTSKQKAFTQKDVTKAIKGLDMDLESFKHSSKTKSSKKNG